MKIVKICLSNQELKLTEDNYFHTKHNVDTSVAKTLRAHRHGKVIEHVVKTFLYVYTEFIV